MSNGVVFALDGDLAERLHRIGMEEHAARLRLLRQLRRSAAPCRSRCSPTSPSRSRRRRARAHRRLSSTHASPAPSTASMRSSAPSCAAWCTAASTALCSMGVVTTARCALRRAAARQLPRTARLSASVPPEVKHDLVRRARRDIAATRSRASSSAARASRPQRCTLDGLPNAGRRTAASPRALPRAPASSRRGRGRPVRA